MVYFQNISKKTFWGRSVCDKLKQILGVYILAWKARSPLNTIFIIFLYYYKFKLKIAESKWAIKVIRMP